jgi:hypothetical protein
MFHIVDALYESTRAILHKYLGMGRIGGPLINNTKLDAVAKAVSVELLPMIISELHRAMVDMAHKYSTPVTVVVEEKKRDA